MFRKIIVIFVTALTVAGCGVKTKEELFGDGNKQLKAGNTNGAIVLFKSALEKDQNYLDARYQLAKAYLAARKYEQAEREFQKIIRQNPARSDVRLEIAKLYNASNKPDMAIYEANEYLKSNPAAPDALDIIGTGYAIKNRLDEAESHFLQTLKADPGRVSAKLELAAVYARKEKGREARGLLDEIIAKDPKNVRAYAMLASLESSTGNRDKALQIYQTIAEINPADLNALYRQATIYLDKGDMANVDKKADEIMRKFPKRPEGHLLKGLVHYGKRNFNEAVTNLQNSLKAGQSLQAYYYLGLSHYNRGELELALSQFRKTLDFNPKFNQVRLLISAILLKQKRIDDAVTEARRVVEADEKNALAHNILGSAYLAKGMPDEAMKELDRAIDLDPKLVDAHLKKGLFNLAKGNAREGEVELQNAVNISPEVLNTRFLLAAYHMRRKNFAKSVSVLKEGIRGQKSDALLYNAMAASQFADKREADGVKSLQRAKEINPVFYAPYFNLAGYYRAKGDTEKSLNEYGGVLKRSPQNLLALVGMAATLESKGKTSEALAYYQKAKETKQSAGYLALVEYHVRKKESGKAMGVLNEALKAEPRNAAALELKGKLYGADKKYKEAIKIFEELEAVAPDRALPLKIGTYIAMKDPAKAVENAQKIITKKPDSAYGYTILASVYESQNDLGKAVDALKNGIRIDGKNPQLSLLLGTLYVKKRDYSSALSTYMDVMKKNPKFAPAIFAQGTTYDLMGKKKEAIRKYSETLKKSPDYVPALNNLAYLYAEGFGDKSEALSLATRAYKLVPGNAGVMDTYGYALHKNGRNAEACKILEKAVTLMPKNCSVRYHLALAEKASGDKARAIQALQKALEIGSFAEADNARRLLAELKR